MFNPTQKDLVCHVIKGQEGIGQIFTTNLTYEQFIEYVDIADTSSLEIEKMQRDTTKSRVKGVTEYLTQRSDTVFPNVTCVATELSFEPLNVESLNGISQLGTMTLPSSAQRMLVDGQGRRLGVPEALKIAEYLRHHTIDFKFIMTGTKTLLEAKSFIRQIFSI